MTLFFSQNNIPGTGSKCTHFKDNIDIRTSNNYQKEKQLVSVGGKQGSEAFACLWRDVPWSGMVWVSLWKDKLVVKMGKAAYLPRKWWAVPREMRWNTVLVTENLLLTFLLVCDWQWNYSPHIGTNTSGPVWNPQDSWEEKAKKLLFPNAPKQSRIHQAGSHHSRQWTLGWSPAVVGSCGYQPVSIKWQFHAVYNQTALHSNSQRKFPGLNRAACVRPEKHSPEGQRGLTLRWGLPENTSYHGKLTNPQPQTKKYSLPVSTRSAATLAVNPGA